MALPNFDSTKHHIGLCPVGGTLKGYMLSGGYRIDPQRFGSSGEFGGTEDQIAPSALDRWTQDDWSGGAFQDNFTNDPAMFSNSEHFLPSLVEKSARTVPPLLFFGSAGAISARNALLVAATGGNQIAIVDDDRIRLIHASTGALITATNPGNTMLAAQHDPSDNQLYTISRRTGGSNEPELRKLNADGSGTTLVKRADTTVPQYAQGMAVTSGKDILSAQAGSGGAAQVLYLWDVNDARDDATMLRVGRLPGRWRDSVSYNGMTYILLTDSEQQTSVHAWDGTSIIPVTEFPYNFLGTCIQVYGGRLYVGGRAKDISGTDKFAEFYEITGSSLRMVKTWGMEARAGFSVPTNIFDMTVHEGFLWLATNRSELIAYDLTRDALWPGIKIRETSSHSLDAHWLLSTREKLIAFCWDVTDTTKDGFYRMATTNADLTDPSPDITYSPFIETSDFQPEPDRDKVWSKLRILSRYTPNPTLQYSVDGGGTWVSAGAATASTTGSLRTTDFDLTNVPVSPTIRFRITYPTKTTVAFTEQIAMTLTFLFLDSGKWSWSFTILGADKPEQLDQSLLTQDIATLRSTLRAFWTDRDPLTFRDVDGSSYTVFLSALNEAQPFIDPSGVNEAMFSVSLTEI